MHMVTRQMELLKREDLLVQARKNREVLRKKMDDLIDLRLTVGLNTDHFTERYRPLDEQVSQLDRSIPELQGEIDFMRIQMNSSDYVMNGVKSLYTDWNELGFGQKRAIAETVTEYIIVGHDTIDIALAYLPGSLQTSQRNFTDS